PRRKHLRTLPKSARNRSIVVGIFFFQAEDGIRDPLVTGVQTCALPIYRNRARRWSERPSAARQLARDRFWPRVWRDFFRAWCGEIGRAWWRERGGGCEGGRRS